MANRGLVELGLGRYAILGHTHATAPAGGIALPNLPNDNRVRRTVIRGKGALTFTLDGSDPTGPDAFYALADEVIVLDSDPSTVLIAGSNVDVRIMYLGT